MIMYRLSRLKSDVRAIEVHDTTEKSVFFRIRDYGEIRTKRESKFSYMYHEWFETFEQARTQGINNLKRHISLCDSYNLKLSPVKRMKIDKHIFKLETMKKPPVTIF